MWSLTSADNHCLLGAQPLPGTRAARGLEATVIPSSGRARRGCSMPSTELFAVFLATTAIFAFIPGPAMLYAAAQTMARGRWSGLMAALGIHLGGYFHVAAAAAGLSVLFHAVPVLYVAVK